MLRGWLGTTAPDIWDLSLLFLSIQFHLGELFTHYTQCFWQRGHASSYGSPVLMPLLMYATVQGDREQWFWGLVWAQKVEQLNAALLLPLRLLHIQQVTHFFLPSPLPDTSLCFLEGGVGFLGEENNHTFPSQLTVLLKRFPLGKKWRVLEIGIRPPPKKATAAVQQGYLWSCPSESFTSTHTCTRAHTHAQPRLNKHCKLAGRGCRLFSIWIVGRGKKKCTRQFIWVEFYWGWFKWKRSLGHKIQIKPHRTHSNKHTHRCKR